MFEWLKEFSAVIVTGPQRSGTRIGAKCVAHDTGHRYVDEVEIKTDSAYELLTVTRRDDNIVIQAPALCHVAYQFAYDDIAVVMMVRDTKDIKKSEGRISWDWKVVEKAHYQELLDYWCWPVDGIAAIKYAHWERYWRRAPNCFEIDYDDLKEHPLWVPKEKRLNFGFSQTKIE